MCVLILEVSSIVAVTDLGLCGASSLIQTLTQLLQLSGHLSTLSLHLGSLQTLP